MNKYVADIENIVNFFLLVAKDLKTGQFHIFRFWYNPEDPKGADRVDDTPELIQFLKDANGFVTFNGLRYDAIIMEFFLRQAEWFEQNYITGDTKATVDLIFAKSQELVGQQEQDELYAANEADLTHSHIDLFAIYHFANQAKRTSLKDCQINIGWHNVQDMPWNFKKYISWSKALEVIDYCVNDVESTEAIYRRSENLIKIRAQLSKEYGLNFMNADDPKMGNMIVMQELIKETGIPESVLKKNKTFRAAIDFGKILLPYISFTRPEYQELHRQVSSATVHGTKGEFNFVTTIDGVEYSLAQGGLHGSVKPGIYQEDAEYGILDIDGKSFYPNLSIVNNWFPAHIGPVFCKVLKNLYDLRMTIPKSNPVNYGLKIALNGVIGQSNSMFSFLLDSLFFMQITINGQLLLMMLAEDATSTGAQVLQANTDGLTIRYKRSDEAALLEVFKKWEKMTLIDLERADYKKICITDVNNYIAQYTDGKYKAKGLYEYEDLFLHKNNSFQIMSMALKAYLLDGVDYKQFIDAHENFLDFCGRCKCNKNNHSYYQAMIEGEVKIYRQQKTLRLYVGKQGAQLMKKYTGGKNAGSESKFIKGWKTMPYNKHNLMTVADHRANLNMAFYYEQVEKILVGLGIDIPKPIPQLQLF